MDTLLDSIIPAFSTTASISLARAITPLFSFFNSWDLVFQKYTHSPQLDFLNFNCWAPITTCLSLIPLKKRDMFLTEFSDVLKRTKILNSLDYNSVNFQTLITAFPTSAMNWYSSLDNKISQTVLKAIHNGGMVSVFKKIVKAATNLNLESSKISFDLESHTISAIYQEDESSVPVKLNLFFPNNYPFAQVKVVCEFGDEGEICAHKVSAAIISQQSPLAGILQWHKFVISRLKDAEPCTVCYSYLSEDMKKPTVACPVCGQKFHSKCLSKWFSKSLKPTCPYCASPWEEKTKKKK